jgi:hypothetical protein
MDDDGAFSIADATSILGRALLALAIGDVDELGLFTEDVTGEGPTLTVRSRVDLEYQLLDRAGALSNVAFSLERVDGVGPVEVVASWHVAGWVRSTNTRRKPHCRAGQPNARRGPPLWPSNPEPRRLGPTTNLATRSESLAEWAWPSASSGRPFVSYHSAARASNSPTRATTGSSQTICVPRELCARIGLPTLNARNRTKFRCCDVERGRFDGDRDGVVRIRDSVRASHPSRPERGVWVRLMCSALQTHHRSQGRIRRPVRPAADRPDPTS